MYEAATIEDTVVRRSGDARSGAPPGRLAGAASEERRPDEPPVSTPLEQLLVRVEGSSPVTDRKVGDVRGLVARMAQMLEVYEFVGAWGLPSASPFCVKLTTWLRMVGIPYERKLQQAPFGTPKGKLPWIRDEDGTRLGDSGFIIEHLRRTRGVTLDDFLSVEQRAISHALRRTLEESLYFVMLYERWIDDAGWALLKTAYFGAIPAPVRPLVTAPLRRGVRKVCHGQGIGRHSLEEARGMGIQDLDAFAAVLADRDFVFGQPSTLDAVAYGMLSGLAAWPLASPLAARVRDDRRLAAYVQRIRERYWSENPSASTLAA